MEADVVVVGAGAIGTSVAYHLAKQEIDVLVVEKDRGAPNHQSGRNSGVIHAGYNVKPGTQKARFCVEGNRELHEFCEDHRVPLRRGGITVIARTAKEQQTLEELQRRANGNGVAADMVGDTGIKQYEPHADGISALHAPEGSSLDAANYVVKLRTAAKELGARFEFNAKLSNWSGDTDHVKVQAGRHQIRASGLINAAGLHADRVAAKLAPDMQIVPFRGFYARLKPQQTNLVRSHIYAAPDLEFPFLGVHLSKRFDGQVYVGPGAMLAFGRQAYKFLHVNPRDLGQTLSYKGFWKMLANPRIKQLMRSEVAKSLSKKAIWNEAHQLVPKLRKSHLTGGAPAGNRAQMIDREGKLVEDIVVRETANTIHVLNAVSPGLTCSLPFGRELASRMAEKL